MPKNRCETFEFIYKLWTSNVYWLNFTPYLRVMTGNSQFNDRTVLNSFDVIPHASTTSCPLNELCTTSPRVQNFVFKLLVLNKKTLCAQLFFLFKSCASKDNTGVTLFPISKFYTTTPHVHMFVLSIRVVHLTPHVHNFEPFLGVAHAEQPM